MGKWRKGSSAAAFLFIIALLAIEGGIYLYIKDLKTRKVVGPIEVVTPAEDTTPPMVAILSPSGGSTVARMVTISATAFDTNGVARVDFFKNGTYFSSDNTVPFSVFWNASLEPKGLFVWSAKAYDGSGNVGTSAFVSLSVDNSLPVIPVASPSSASSQGSNQSASPSTPTHPTSVPSPTPTPSVPPTPSTPSPSITFTALSQNLSYNTSTTLNWSSQNANSCVASGAWSGTRPTSGSQSTGNLTENRTYQLKCTGPGGSMTKNLSIVVASGPAQNPPPPPPPSVPSPTVSLSVANVSLAYNTATTLSWSSTDATSCIASGNWSGQKASSGSESTGNLTSSKTYTLTCSNVSGEAARSVSVAVSSPPSQSYSILAQTLISQITSMVLGKTPPSFSGNPPYPQSSVNIFNADGTRNSQIWANGVDLTCIPRSIGTNGVLVTKRDMIFAAHYGVSNPTFVDNSNNPVTKTVVASQRLIDPVGNDDILVATLDSDVPSGIMPCALAPANIRSYTPPPTLFFDQQNRYPIVFTNQDRTLLIADIVGYGSTVRISPPSITQSYSAWFYPLRTYDSGAPAFLLLNGRLGLLTNWQTTTSGPVPFDNISQINAAISANGSPYSITTLNLNSFQTY